MFHNKVRRKIGKCNLTTQLTVCVSAKNHTPNKNRDNNVAATTAARTLCASRAVPFSGCVSFKFDFIYRSTYTGLKRIVSRGVGVVFATTIVFLTHKNRTTEDSIKVNQIRFPNHLLIDSFIIFSI